MDIYVSTFKATKQEKKKEKKKSESIENDGMSPQIIQLW